MRDIKFRGWTGNEMVEPAVISRGDWFVDDRDFEDALPCGGPLMQFTGLRDKNGKEIYENDIVQVFYEWPGSYHDEGDTGHFIGAVYFRPSSGYGLTQVIKISDADEPQKHRGLQFIRQSRAEVIGNIHEHPELLQEPEQCK